MISKEEIKEFLRSKPGYLHEGRKRLRKILLNRGLEATTESCRQAIYEITQELKFPSLTNNASTKVLFYDIEVSYGIARAWRPSYKTRISYNDFLSHPRIICISYKWADSDEVSTVQWTKDQDDKTLLQEFVKELNKADFIIAHNGDGFDLPWIRTRCLVHGIELHPKYQSVDTLKIARYRHKFPSNRLDDLGDYLGLGRKLKTGMELWDKVILNNDAEALSYMVEYCEQDVLLLENIYNKLKPQELNITHVGVTKQMSPYTGGKNIELVKTTTSKAGTKKHLMKCLDTNQFFEMSNTDYKKYLITV